MKFSEWQKKYIKLRRAIARQSEIVEETDNSQEAYEKYCESFKKNQIGILLKYESWCAGKKLTGTSLELRVKQEQAVRDHEYLINLKEYLPRCIIKKIFREEHPYWKSMKERYSL